VKVRYTPEAIVDLLSIAEYLVQRSPAAAIAVEQAILSAIDQLERFPHMGRDRTELGVRALGIPRQPYTAYYRIDGDEIWIIHIRHGRRRPVEPSDL
jgi:toxin ParE1/3/4